MKTIVVEGFGHITRKAGGYGPSLQKLKIDIPTLSVIFADLKDPSDETLRWLALWGGQFLNKSDVKYSNLLNEKVDAVIVATPDSTHLDVAKYWLSGNCSRVFVEKPLTDDEHLPDAREWIAQLKNQQPPEGRVEAFDHYRARVHAHLRYPEHMAVILRQLGRIQEFRFYFLEDHSGSDARFISEQRNLDSNFKDRNGPIENENRVDALRSGLILDLMPHVVAILEYFGKPETIEVRTVRAATYAGVDYDRNKRAEINNETFASIEFDFENNSDFPGTVRGQAYIGKGIGGSRNYPDMAGNVKVLEVVGETGVKLEFDFVYNVLFRVENGEKSPLLDLEPHPYYYFLKDVAFKRFKGTTLSLPIEMAEKILSKLTDFRCLINPEKLLVYQLGSSPEDGAPDLEDLLPGGSQEIPLLLDES
jgi:predicted dehydrogenase